MAFTTQRQLMIRLVKSSRWMSSPRLGLLTLSLSFLAGNGCANMNHAQTGTLMGTAIGSIAGAAIGADSGNAGLGAMVGGVTGAVAGNIIGNAEDALDERDRAIAERNSVIANASWRAQNPPLNNFDLIRLAQSGVSDDVIVNMIQTRGGQFELGTDAIITLKSNGVSDRVILAAQTAAKTPVPPAPGVVVVKEQPAVIVEPAPVIVGGWWGPHYHHHHRFHHHPRHRTSVGFSFGF